MNIDDSRLIETVTRIVREIIGRSVTMSPPISPAEVAKTIPTALNDNTETDIHKYRSLIDLGVDRIGLNVGVDESVASGLAKYIDHTLLKAEVTKDELNKLCEEAKKYVFASVCVNPANVKFCADSLKNYPVKITAVIGFPLGATTTAVKVFEAKEAIANGADEIDMVINIGELKTENYTFVERDIRSVKEAIGGHILKVIIETALLSDKEKIAACVLAKAAAADYVKTSTGFAKSGATVDDVMLMRQVVGPEMGIKAAGGIHDYETAKKMLKAGATRIGASASVQIIKPGQKAEPSAGY